MNNNNVIDPSLNLNIKISMNIININMIDITTEIVL